MKIQTLPRQQRWSKLSDLFFILLPAGAGHRQLPVPAGLHLHVDHVNSAGVPGGLNIVVYHIPTLSLDIPTFPENIYPCFCACI